MKRKLSLLMVLMMVLTLIPAMPSFAAQTLTEDAYTSTDLESPNGFVVATSNLAAETVRQGNQTKVKILRPSTTGAAFVATKNSQVTFTLSPTGGDDQFYRRAADAQDVGNFVNRTAFEITITNTLTNQTTVKNAGSTGVNVGEGRNYIAVDLVNGDRIDEVRFRAQLNDTATGRRVLEVNFPTAGRRADNADSYTIGRDLRYAYAQTGAGAMGQVNRLEKEKEFTPNTTWRVNKGARFNIINPQRYTNEVFSLEGNDAVELRLNSDFNWVVGQTGPDRTRIFIDGVEFDYAATGNHKLNVAKNILTIYPSKSLPTPADYRGFVTIEVQPAFSLTRDARIGQDIVVDVTSAKANGSVVIGKYVDFTTGIKVEDVREIMAGSAKESKDYRVKITITDNALGLASLRDVDMDFANGTAKLVRAEGIDRTKVDGFRQGSRVPVGIENGGLAAQYADSFKFTTINQSNNTEVTTDQEEIVLEFYLRADNNAGGKDMTVNVKGRGIDYKDVKVATVIAPVAMTVDEVKNVELGLQAQESGTIVLAESKAGALERGRDYEIVLNDTDSSSATGQIKILDGYKVEVVDGNGLELRTSVNGGVLRITVLRESITNPAKITLSNMRITTDRTVAYGDIKAELIPVDSRTFTAYNLGYRDTAATVFTLIEPRTVDVNRVKTILASQKYMKLATEALTGVKKETVFTIGSTSYTVAGVANTLDAAPYISNNRTMLPIGTVAKLVGATVNYDTTTRTAVFTKDNLVVTMNLDTNMLLVNGSAVPMDAKPEIQNGRAFVSLVYVAQAFGIQNGTDIVYDAAAKTVTLFPNAQ